MSTFLEERDYTVKTLPFPNNSADGCVVADPSGSGFVTIVLNANVSRKRQEEAYRHELEHILNDDLYSEMPVSEIEKRAFT